MGNTVAITKFCGHVYGDSEIRYLMAFVRNESDVLVESYSRVNIENALPHYYYIASRVARPLNFHRALAIACSSCAFY